MKEKKSRVFWICLVIIILVVGTVAGVYLLKEDKTNDDSGSGKNNSDESSFVVEEDVEEVTDNSIYVRKTFMADEKYAKIEYKYENSTYEIKINNKKVKDKKITSGGDYQIAQLNDVIVIAIKSADVISGFSIFAFDFKGKQILAIDDYVDAEKYLSLREYGDSAVYDNWAFQIVDSTITVISGRVNAGAIDGISDPCNKSVIAEAKFTDDTIMAAQHSISYLGNSKFTEPKIERVNIDYLQYKSVFPCR